jgi:RNA polymerase sigma-70 factor (ECF subfamily)
LVWTKKRDKSEASALGERLHEPIFDVTEAVLGVLMSEYLAMREVLLRFLTARLGDPAAADDVYQELFVRLRAGALPQDLTNPKGYLFRMAYNLANELSRARRRQEARDIHWTDATTQKVGTDTISDTAAADEALASKERLAAVMRALEGLPPKTREVFVMCRVRGLSHRDIAEVMGISTKTVEKHMTAALKHLTLILRSTEGERH